jgi:hypothetical protein
MTYKIVDIGDSVSISKDNMSIPRSSDNRHYRMFIEDIALDNDTVEGPDVIEPSYVELRAAAYPSMVDQLDMQYWDNVNGTTTWADAIQAVKNAHPTTVTGGTTVGAVPDWVQEEADAWLLEKQIRDYAEAVERLAQYQLSVGVPESSETIVTGQEMNMETGEMQDVTETFVIPAIPALEATVEETTYDFDTDTSSTATVANPVIVKDNEERAAAQAIIDATPGPVKTHVDG